MANIIKPKKPEKLTTKQKVARRHFKKKFGPSALARKAKRAHLQPKPKVEEVVDGQVE